MKDRKIHSAAMRLIVEGTSAPRYLDAGRPAWPPTNLVPLLHAKALEEAKKEFRKPYPFENLPFVNGSAGSRLGH